MIQVDSLLTGLSGDKPNSTVVLTGAGISISAGLPSGPDMVRSAVARLLELLSSSDGIVGVIGDTLPLEVFFQVVADHAGESVATRVINVLDASVTTPIHQWVAAQQLLGRIFSLYTFNFDTLHELALEEQFTTRVVGRSVVLEAPSGGWRITKLHGSATVRGVISIGEYVQGFTDPIRAQLLEDWHNRLLLVLGYGGWDADLRITVDEAIAVGRLPRAVVWVDQSFPITGGRSDILNEMEEAGVVCHRVVADFSRLSDLPAGKETEAISVNKSFEYGWDEFSRLDLSIVRAILADACLLSDQLDQAAILTSLLAAPERRRLEALLYDRKGDKTSALAQYQRLLKEVHPAPTLAMAAARAFTLSVGQVDLFDEVPVAQLPIEMACHFEAFVQSRRSDTGGLERADAAKKVGKLPRPFETASGVKSLDGVRLYISLILESARLLHEDSDFSEALELDKRAMRFAQAIGDPVLLSMTAGGVGVCFMGIAEQAIREDADKHWASAEKWLRIGVREGRDRSGDYAWGLHMCNLGSVLSERGDPRTGIEYILQGLPALTAAYPNWAVSCHGFLAMAYCDAFDLEGNPTHIDDGVRALAAGWALANQLKDYDDAHILRQAETKLRERSVTL